MTGRCAGCGKTGPPKPLSRHVVECGPWLALPPDRQLEPEPEMERWQAEDKDGERDARRERAIEASTAAHAAAGLRFAQSRDLDAELDAMGFSLAHLTEDPVFQVELLEMGREAGEKFLRGLDEEAG